jgi:hypothetical protein
VIPPQQGGLTDAHARKNTHKYDGFWIVMSYRGQRLINKRSKNGVTSPQSRIQIEVEFVADHERRKAVVTRHGRAQRDRTSHPWPKADIG